LTGSSSVKSAGFDSGLLPVQEQKSVAKMLPNVAKDPGVGGNLASKMVSRGGLEPPTG